MDPKREKRPPLADNIGTKYTLLDLAFDNGHHTHFIENGMMILPLRMRGHTKAVEMQYDERYVSYFKRARLLGFVPQFKRLPLMLVHSALTTLLV
ncbi:Serine/threonine-protein phosphatase 7 long form-like protein [Hordeum vulgare]|nr:Serine/threonine-protein phosphatase 7 long form-like protein [Hordeum vulgare]